MRPTFVLVCVAALAVGLSIGLVARGGRVDALPEQVAELGRGAGARTEAAPRAERPSPTLTSTPATAPPNTGPVDVAGLMVHRTLRRDDESGEALAFFGTFASTRVALELDLAAVPEAAGLRVVSFLREESEVTRFTDDHGTDFLGDDELVGGPYELAFPRISADGLGLQVVVASEGRPRSAAQRLEVAGSLALLCASERTTVLSEEVALQPGVALEVAGLAFELVERGPSDWDPDKLALELETTAELDHVVEWALVDAGGEVVPLEESMTWTINGTVRKTLLAPRALDRGALRLELWETPRRITVPYTVSTGLGLR